ncbi:unnamed protein product [Durusdinium trenchii]|uniref:Uncharacterized protein n=2 Tax=Durusdinium trenchii TaxID=1381693 RepID=A0ABP0JZW5_9DINO
MPRQFSLEGGQKVAQRGAFRYFWTLQLLWFAGIAGSTNSDSYPPCTFDSCEICLEDKTNASRTLLVEGPDHNLWPTAVRIARCQNLWESQALTAQLIGILIFEKLGLSIDYVHAEDEADALHAIAGCASWWESHESCDIVKDQQTAQDQGKKRNPDPVPDILFHSEMAPRVTMPSYLDWSELAVSLGTIGFRTQRHIYIHHEISEDAWQREKLALEHWRLYTIDGAIGYFDTPRQLMQSGLAAQYLTPNCTSADDTVQAGIDLHLEAGWICHESSWWLTPACADLGAQWMDLCIPLLDDDWGYPKPALYRLLSSAGLRIAKLTVGYSVHNDVILHFRNRTLFHWWDTDSTYKSRHPLKLHLSGAAEGHYNEKMVYPPLLAADEQLKVLLSNILVTNDHLNEMLLQMADAMNSSGPLGSLSPLRQKVACDWLRKNGEVWKSWLPDPRTCSLGQGYDAERSRCEICNEGTFSNRSDGEVLLCQPCPPGHQCPTEGMVMPQLCPAGTFANESGRETCERCSIGNFANFTGGTICRRCEDVIVGSTTVFKAANEEKDCECPAGTYQEQRHCRRCFEGLLCKGGEHPPRQEAGYYVVQQDNKFSVFRCADSARCLEGELGGCAAGRDGLLCGRCLPGRIPGPESTCVDCQGTEMLIVGVICTLYPIVVVWAYTVLNRSYAKQSHSLLQIGIVTSMCLVVLQQFGALGGAQVPWVPPTSVLLETMQLFTFDIEVLRTGCVLFLPAFWRYAARLIISFFLLFSFFVVHLGHVILQHRGAFGARWPALMRVLGTIFLLFQIAIANAALVPFECMTHPNQLATVIKYPTVICSLEEDGDWMFMAILGLFSVVLICSWVTTCAVLVYQCPAQLARNNDAFFKASGFLFMRMNPEAYWFVLIVVLRNLFVPGVSTVPDAVFQVTCFQALQLIYLCLLCRFQPWRLHAGNSLDMVITSGLILFLSAAAITVGEVNLFATSVLCSSVVVCIFALNLLLFLAVLYRHFRQHVSKPFSFYLCHHKAETGAFARLLKIYFDEFSAKSALYRNQQVFLDIDNLNNMEQFLDYVGSQSENVVVLFSGELLFRPWCLGELVMAHLERSRIRTMPVYWPDMTSLDDNAVQSILGQVDTVSLLPHGITSEMIEDMLPWFRSLPYVRLPRSLDSRVMDTLAAALMSGSFSGKVILPELAGGGEGIQVCLVADHSNMEACAAGLVLVKNLMSLTTAAAPQLTPHFLLEHETTLPLSTSTVIFMLSIGAFYQPSFMKSLVCAGELSCKALPVICDDFRFTGKVFLKEFTIRAPMRFASSGLAKGPEDLVQLIVNLLKEVSVVFCPQKFSQELLRQRSKTVLQRLMAGSLRQLVQNAEMSPTSDIVTDYEGSGSMPPHVVGALFLESKPLAKASKEPPEPTETEVDGVMVEEYF